jgi:MFS family permease
MLVSPPPTTSQASASGKVTAQPAKGMTLQEALRSRTFWTLWGTILLIGTSGINVAGVYKAFGSRLHPADDFQALVGSLAALANGAGRLFWGNILDAFGFKKPFAALVTLQAIAMALYSTVSSSKVSVTHSKRTWQIRKAHAYRQ